MEDQQQKKYQLMTETPVSRLIPRMALPCVVSMLVTAFYNMADTFFVGMLKSNAATGAVGVVRRDPMAMLPFCGYHMGDYWQHWLDMGEKLGDKAPKIFNVNWFRTDDDGNFLWPGFGDNLRVLEWILKRCFGEVEAVETPIGWEPRPEDIDLEDSGVELDTLRGLLGVDTALWRDEVKGIREFYQKFGDRLPRQLSEELDVLDARLN